MQILMAVNGGFCFGVRRAIDKALAKKASTDQKIHTYGPIIHNPQVVGRLALSGIVPTDDPEMLSAGEVIVIRSHGVGPDEFLHLNELGLDTVDATCPFVRKIQQKAFRCKERGIPVIIVGEKNHPEVKGILGWSGPNAYVVNSTEDVTLIGELDTACIMAQTTTSEQHWEDMVHKVRKHVKDLEVFESICRATLDRQHEAEQLAESCCAMIVIGGRNSSNTQKLEKICRERCSHVYLIENSGELPAAEELLKFKKIGIVSGASTPDWIIKEVFITMSEIDNKDLSQNQADAVVDTVAAEKTQAPQEEEIKAATIPSAGNENGEVNFAEDFEKMMVTIHPGQLITGKVVSVNENEVCVNIGYKSDGFISRSEFSTDDVKLTEVVKEGDELDVEVIKVNDGEGNVLLSRKNVEARKQWKEFMDRADEGGYITAVGKQAVKGGLLANANGIRAFIPASQLDTKYVENIETFVGQTMDLKIIEVEKSRKRIVASRKAFLLEAAEKARAEKWDALHEGDQVTGIVRRLTDFGAFVDIGGVDGLVHVTNLAWGRVQHPKDIVSIGQELDCVILKVDRENQRVSLGHKQLTPKPWDVASSKYIPGTVVTGKVVRLVSFGAFVELEPGLDGLVHISQIADKRIDKVENVLTPGQIVDVKILDVNPGDHRISLSIRDAQTEKSDSDYSSEDYEDEVTEETASDILVEDIEV